MTTIVNHAGLTVPDVFGAIDWYASVFGFRLIMGPRVLSVDSAPETRRIYGPGFVKGYHAHLLSDGGVGLEIFEFVEPPVDPPEEDSTHTRRGLSYLCLTVADLDEAASRVVAAVGKRSATPRSSSPAAHGAWPTSRTPGPRRSSSCPPPTPRPSPTGRDPARTAQSGC